MKAVAGFILGISNVVFAVEVATSVYMFGEYPDQWVKVSTTFFAFMVTLVLEVIIYSYLTVMTEAKYNRLSQESKQSSTGHIKAEDMYLGMINRWSILNSDVIDLLDYLLNGYAVCSVDPSPAWCTFQIEYMKEEVETVPPDLGFVYYNDPGIYTVIMFEFGDRVDEVSVKLDHGQCLFVWYTKDDDVKEPDAIRHPSGLTSYVYTLEGLSLDPDPDIEDQEEDEIKEEIIPVEPLK